MVGFCPKCGRFLTFSKVCPECNPIAKPTSEDFGKHVPKKEDFSSKKKIIPNAPKPKISIIVDKTKMFLSFKSFIILNKSWFLIGAAILAVVILAFIFSGNVEEDEENFEEIITPEPRCKLPRTLIGDKCCLDNNGNSICDLEEVVREPVRVIEEIEDWCKISKTFYCDDIQIYQDPIFGGKIKITLRYAYAGLAVVNKFDFPSIGCSKEYPNWLRDVQGIKSNESSQFTIDCDFPVEKYVESDMKVTTTLFEPVDKGGGRMDFEMKPPINLAGEIKGTI